MPFCVGNRCLLRWWCGRIGSPHDAARPDSGSGNSTRAFPKAERVGRGPAHHPTEHSQAFFLPTPSGSIINFYDIFEVAHLVMPAVLPLGPPPPLANALLRQTGIYLPNARPHASPSLRCGIFTLAPRHCLRLGYYAAALGKKNLRRGE